jgi:hypothetical protein
VHFHEVVPYHPSPWREAEGPSIGAVPSVERPTQHHFKTSTDREELIGIQLKYRLNLDVLRRETSEEWSPLAIDECP